MPQFRLTAKIAKALKVLELKNPNNCTKLYDDWYLDVTRISRKKVFIFMHIHSKIAFAIPSYEIGGINSLFECFALLLRDCLNSLGYEEIAEQAYDYFCCHISQINFVKTNDKSTLRYVSNFILQLDIAYKKLNDISQYICDNVSEDWLDHFIKYRDQSNAYTTPRKLLKKLLP
ncbi:DUF6933 domain-containing protein [Candidatus Tisiphia endosymbiont of Sialis lutaria]|uniref:DUF6933 domain-containing protein n=1 Tax=Candidatus Tisiphia endosymbiont of Sialis lutaria TaxID=2029164 RepID=UPI00312C8A32